ncbi:phosphonate ABC transporter, permease protein PhnE [Acerihabitans sp. KWT182]|uniref:Phosphonate ABC transporter, permease protein PhnE n=1 Tax=Acerihabitans sp. KWT182 TaxID=3157919 RepID=A0AAU7QDM5_9GAMM
MMSISKADSPSRFSHTLATYSRTVRKTRWQQLFNYAVILVILLVSANRSEVSIWGILDVPGGIINYLGRTVPNVSSGSLQDSFVNWFWDFPTWLTLLFESLIMALVATILGVLIALPLSFVAARNGVSHPVTRFLMWRIFQIARAVPEVAYALLFVFAFGPGALAGILAIAVHAVGALGKLFAEAHENVSMGTIAGLQSTGARTSHIYMHGVFPQSLPEIISYTLLRFEINVRASAIIGMVGAGGIGQELYFAIRQFHYTDISAIILMIIGLVIIIDSLASTIRHRVIESSNHHVARSNPWGTYTPEYLIRKKNTQYRISMLAAVSTTLIVVFASLSFTGVTMNQLFNGFSRLGFLVSHMFPPESGSRPTTLFAALIDTLAIAIFGTTLAVILALPLGFLGARNFISNRYVHQALRCLFDTLRSVDVLIWGIIFAGVVGLGPFAGVLAIAAADIGALAKLFADAIENVDRRQVEAIKSTGACRFQEARFGYLPPVFPVMLSQTLYFFEANVRSASILGIVGAGGIGLYLSEALRIGEWQPVGYMILLILFLVIVTEYLCGKILKRVQSKII